MIIITMTGILIAIFIVILFIIKHKNIWEQIFAANAITNLVVLLILLFSLYQESSVYIDVAILYSLLSFIGSLFVIVFIYRRGDL